MGRDGRTAIVLALLALPAGGAAASRTKGVDGGVITVNRGAVGVTLGMTRAQVIARLGRPLREWREGLMRYGKRGAMFDVYRRGSRVEKLGIAAGASATARRRFRLPDGNRVFERGGIRRLKRHYGRRVKLIHYDLSGEPIYRISGRYRGRRVVTDFSFHRGRAESVFIFPCPPSGSCGAAPPS